MVGKDDKIEEEGKERYWKRRKSSDSKGILFSFIVISIILFIVLASISVYGYMEWRDWNERPKIKIQRGLYEFHKVRESNIDNITEGNITVHLTLLNDGEEDSKDLNFEWLVMKEENSTENIFFKRGSKPINPIPKDEDQEITFNLSLKPGEYVLVYRAYEEGYFSYEGRQLLEVTYEDIIQETDKNIGDGDGGDGEYAEEGDGVPMTPAWVFLVILFIYAIIRRRFNENR